MSKVVFITGCSSGIGRDLAGRLAGAGYRVVATARNVESLASLQVSLKLSLDVTSPESIRQAVATTIEHFGRIDVLVNNAGYAVRGAVEEVPVSQARQMFEANLFGVMNMVQAVLPHMRAQKSGRIINISSVVGKLVTPANGVYSASKFALEGLSDALRMELAPFGIQVVVVEPGSIHTQFHATVEANAQTIFSNPASPYRSLYERYEQVTRDMRKSEPEPAAVSQVVEQVIAASKVKARYVAGFPFPGSLVLFLRDQLWEPVVKQMFNLHAPMTMKDSK
ncbi:MAG TPA: SDR family oxidoreductase [Anaerolineales bacterium]|jgi:NAD(P)-dependent dehydrogenase (short-subunit alcohol dehydrogenase family)